MRITSMKTDPKKSNYSYCCWGTISAGHVLSLSDETGRDGGELWSKKNGSLNGTLQQVLASLARNWPNFYSKVTEKAYRDKIPPLSTVQKKHHNRDVNMIKSEIEDLENQLRDKKSRLRKVQRRYTR